MIPAAQSGRLPKTNSTRWRFTQARCSNGRPRNESTKSRSTDPENVAVANWRESIAGSQLAGDCLVADAIDHIEEIRTVLEPEAQKSRRLQRRIRSIIRKLDRRRMEDQQEILDPTTTPSFGKSGATVSEVVAEEVPEDLKPQSMKADSDPTNGHDENDTLGFDLLDDSEALQPDQ